MALLKNEEVMEYFKISRSCLYQWRKKGKIPYIKIGTLNFYIEEVIIKMVYIRAKMFDEEVNDPKE